VDEAIAEVAGSVRENIQLRRAYRHAPTIFDATQWLDAQLTRNQFAATAAASSVGIPNITLLLPGD